MKTKKIFIGALLFINCISISACSGSSNTKYYVPEVDDNYKSTSLKEFEKDFKEKCKFEYNYFAAEIEYKNPVGLSGGAIIVNDEHYVGKINKDFMEDKKRWYIEGCNRSMLPKIDFTLLHFSCFDNPYDFTNGEEFTVEPYSYVVNNSQADTYTKYVFDDNFCLSSIIDYTNDNEATINFKYFNAEDLPTKAGEISRETYQEIAFTKKFSNYDNYSKVKIKFDCKNAVIKDEITIVDNVPEATITYGDTSYVAEFDIVFLGEGTNKIKETSDYIFSLNNFSLLSGEKVEEEEMFIHQRFNSIPMSALSSTFVSPYHFLDEKETVFTNKPLTVKNKMNEEKESATFDENGFITQYTIEKDSKTSMKVTLEYI